MNLAEIVDKVLKPIGLPTDERETSRLIQQAGHAELVRVDVIEEEGEKPRRVVTPLFYDRAWRVGRAWMNPQKPPTVDLRMVVEDRRVKMHHLLPPDFPGTYNVGMPPYLGATMQRLRDRAVDPSNPAHVAAFVRETAAVLDMYLPTVLAKALHDRGVSTTGITGISAHFAGTKEHWDGEQMQTKAVSWEVPYAQLLAMQPDRLDGNPTWHEGVRLDGRSVQTIGGATSFASTVSADYDSMRLDVTGSVSGPGASFLAIHRGGILSSIVGAALAQKFGLETQIVGVDAKRANEGGDHYAAVSGVRLTPPIGYSPSQHSQLVEDHFVYPSSRLEGPRLHFVIDPMLATGVSAAGTLEHYMRIEGCQPEDVYVVALFAGDYQGIDRLHQMGVNVLVLAHDQAVLSSNGYIQPGLGDAGDKLSGEGVVDVYANLHRMLHLGETDAVVGQVLNQYALQMTGRELVQRAAK